MNETLTRLDVPPKASAFMESLRGIGYNLDFAVADIIDNSIAAEAQTIDVRVEYDANGGASRLMIFDDGCGMTREELIRAMSLGAVSPNETRRSTDLGRFGLGLKTASLSQCRRVTVVSKRNGELSGFAWDLDVLQETDQWTLEEIAPSDGDAALIPGDHGTAVFWERFDRSLQTATESELDQICEHLRKHLSLVFHRFLDEGDFDLSVNGRAVDGWDPFFSDDPAKPYDLPCAWWPKGATPSVELQAYVLPNPDVTDKQITLFGDSDELDLQGFFLYRGKRLIHAGGWLGIRGLNKAREFKLARIRIDFRNADDFAWHLDVRKSQARPPREIRPLLAKHAEAARRRSEETVLSRLPSRTADPMATMWRKPARGAAALPDPTDPILSTLYSTLEAGRLTPEILDGYLEILAYSHPQAGRKSDSVVPTGTIRAATANIYRELKSDLSPEEARILMCARVPFSSWGNMMNEIFLEGEDALP